jgi:PIN domain nuclease of toxin-antitoxin system
VNILLDTVSFLWFALATKRLSKRAVELFESLENNVFLSAISAYEIATKYRSGRLRLPDKPAAFIREQRRKRFIRPLFLTETAALRVDELPEIHRDPFDRLIVCQALEHGLTILTPDETIARYPVRVVW